jgi:aspartate aminotransferase
MNHQVATMSHPLSDRIKSLPVSETLAMAAKARELKEQGKDIISLSLGEPDFNTPDFIKDAAIQAINDNYNSYSPVNGYADLREAICRKFKRDNNLDYNINQIVVSTGAKQSIANVAMVLLNPGDEVILPAPYWVSYSAISILAEARYIEIPSSIDTDFKITPEQLEAAITPKTKMIFFNSPNNPSGTVYTEAEYRALAKVLEKYPQIYILSDEIYEHINYGVPNFSFAAIESMYDRTITVNGIAKAFAMTGWRIGYIGAPEWIAKACNKMQGQITSGANCIAQRATITALDAPVSKIQYMIDEFKIRRDLILGLLSKIKGIRTNVAKGAFYVFPDVSYYFGKTIDGTTVHNASDFSMLLLEKANVATVAGDAFGAPECIRISYAASQEDLKEAMKRIAALLA